MSSIDKDDFLNLAINDDNSSHLDKSRLDQPGNTSLEIRSAPNKRGVDLKAKLFQAFLKRKPSDIIKRRKANGRQKLISNANTNKENINDTNTPQKSIKSKRFPSNSAKAEK